MDPEVHTQGSPAKTKHQTTYILLESIEKRKRAYFGYLTRGKQYEILRTNIGGKVAGKKSVDFRQNSWLKILLDD